MSVITPLILNIIPLFILIALGYIGGKKLDLNLSSIARINIFILIPFVMFGAIMQMEFNPAYMLLPILLMGVSAALTAAVYNITRFIFKDGRANLSGIATVNGNAIYFGLPLIFHLFGPTWAGVYLFMNLGPAINNISVGYFLAARGQHDLKKSLVRLAKFPAIHATWLAFSLSFAGVDVESDLFIRYWDYAAGTMTILGMMMIGIGLSKLDRLEIDFKFISALFAARFLIWPLTIGVLIMIDKQFTQLFDTTIYTMMFMWSSMPVMGNLVAYAAEYDVYPEKAATGVLTTSLFAIITIPATYLIATHLF